MITIDNFKKVLKDLNFVEDKSKKSFVRQFDDSVMIADFANKKLIYPHGLKAYRDTTQNFSENENFVVFECIARLLIKGYKAEHIELEKPMPGGHHDTGGYCDILIKDNDGKTFLLIECKRADEFDKYWGKMLINGGQLFNYYNSYRQAQALCLYTSDYTEDGTLKYISHIVSMTDNEEYLQSNKKLISFNQVKDDNGGKDEYFKVWKDTYQLDFNEKGIFEDDIAAYTIGKLKYTVNDLSEVDNDSIQKKYHEFATILRQHNVGSHENAFDKLVNLFLAKIVDESVNADELQFYWKGAAHDDYFSLQDRLQKLYKDGMEKFLGEQVTYIDQKEIGEAFHLFKNDPDATKDKVLEYFRQLKFFTNNDFAFLDVHNESLFYQNAVILKKFVQMLENIKLKTKEHNQFLGDLFEGFLDQGVKQNEGQFFTPIPIVKFLVSSLPIEQIVKNSSDIPKAIDYACGAGHFLTEYASCIKSFSEKHKTASASEYYKNTYGIEKEYRLSKVAKVSAFMYGYDDIKIIYGDALAESSEIKDNQFSVLIANPPYSVKGFLETLTEENRSRFYLTTQISDISKNNSIETFFTERAKQLLKGDGVAAIVLPSSILSNGNIYISCREIILKYFDIAAIAEFGSGTFGKTGTNTVVLFMRRKQSNPDIAEHYLNRVNSWFSGDGSKDIVFHDENMIDEYCAHCRINASEYRAWLNGGAPPCASIFDEYEEKAKDSTVYKNILKKKITSRYTEEEQKRELSEYIIRFIKTHEKEKLYYFMLAWNNAFSVIVSKSPTDKKEIKTFLGYEWSGSKGNEGIKYMGSPADDDDAIGRNKGIDSIKTPLFDPHNYNNNEKINTVIRKNFEEGIVDIPDSLQKFVSSYRLVDMLDFSHVDFDKAIKTNVIQRKIKSKYETVKLSSVVQIISGGTPDTKVSNYWNGDIPWLSVSDFNNDNRYVSEAEKHISEDGLNNSSTSYLQIGDIIISARGTVGAVAQIASQMTFNQSCYGLRGTDKIINDYLYYVLLNEHEQIVSLATGTKFPAITKKTFDEITIPLPPLAIQKQIADECGKADEERQHAIRENELLNEKIESIIASATGKFKKVSEVCLNINPSKAEIRSIPDDTLVSFVEMASVSNDGYIETKKDVPLKNLRKGSYTYFAENDIIIAKITPCMENGKCAPAIGLTNGIGMGSSEFHVFRADTKTVLSSYLFYSLNRETVRKSAATQMTGSSGHRRVPVSFYENLEIAVPELREQGRIVSEIEAVKQQIAQNKSIIGSCADKKKLILKKLL